MATNPLHALAAAVAFWVLLPLASAQEPAAAAETVASPNPVLEAVGSSDAGFSTAAGEALTLVVRKSAADMPLAGESVEWTVSGPKGARLSTPRSLTSTATEESAGGTAEVSFTAEAPGSYRVVASTSSEPACSGPTCRGYATVEFPIEVLPAAQAESSVNRTGLVVGAAAAAGLAALLSGGDEERPQEVVRAIAIASGDGQFGLPGRPLGQPLVVNVRDNGANAAGITVQWSASGGATLSAATSASDGNGLASVTVTSMGPGPGPVVVTATRSDAPSAVVSFSLGLNTPALNKISGDNQSAPTLTVLPSALVVQALLNNAPQSGLAIQWSVTGGNATVDSVANGGLTDAQGRSSAIIRFGSAVGPVTVIARRSDVPNLSQTFTLTAIQTRTLDIQSGDGQSGPQNAPLPQALVVQARNAGIADVGLTILWSASGDIELASPSSVTDGSGLAQVAVTSLGREFGPATITATRADDPSVHVEFEVDVLPPSVGAVSGNNQSGLVGSVANQPLTIQLLDGLGAPMAGETVEWQVTGGSASLAAPLSTTDGSGHASMVLTFGTSPGPVSIVASAFDGGVEFEFDANAVAADGLLKISGDGQSADPGTQLAPFVVRVQPPAGITAVGGGRKPQALSGVPITFAIVSGKGTLSTVSAVTDINGEASTTLTLSLTPGNVAVQATAAGGQSATFNALATGTLVASTLQIVSGDGQVLVPVEMSQPMVVELIANGTPLAGQTITWSTTVGRVLSPTTVTDANGRASNTVQIAAPANVQVTASFAGFAAYDPSSVTFNHTSTLAALPQLDTNEASVAQALDNACAALQSGGEGSGSLTPAEQDLLAQCLGLSAGAGEESGAVADAIEELLPDVAESQSQASQTAATAQFDNLKGRIANLRAGATGLSFSGLTLTGSGGTLPLFGLGSGVLGLDQGEEEAGSQFGRWGLFVSGNIGRGESEAQALSPRFDFDVNGLTIGVDYRQSDRLVLGVALGYTQQDTALAAGEGDVEMTGLSLSGYGTWYQDDSWYLDGVLTLGRNDYDHRRRVAYVVPLPGGGSLSVDQQARASAGGNDVTGSLTFGRDFQRGGWSLGVYGRANYSRLGFDAFSERLDGNAAGSGLGLRVESRTVTAVSSVLGGKASFAHSADWGVLMPTFDFEWQREYRSDPEAFRAFFLNDPSATPILVVGDRLDNSYFRLGLGLSMVLTEGRSGFLRYERIIARDGISQDSLALGFRMEF